MKSTPIIMTAESLRAILADPPRKNQTRRIMTPQPEPRGTGYYFDAYCSEPKTDINPRGMSDEWCWWTADHRPAPSTMIRCPYGQPGDRSWVKESVAIRADVDPAADLEKALHYLIYRADYRDGDLSLEWHDYGRGWISPLFMPRWASRITLEVAEVRVQRLQEISEDDARAEGSAPGTFGGCRAAFVYLWERINAKRATWASNPFVWALTFRRLS